MIQGNDSAIMEFMLLGISEKPELQSPLFFIFLIVFILILMVNFLVIITTACDPVLSTPMYFFLRNLAFMEICYTSVTIPKMLINLILKKKTISFVGCGVQFYFFLFLGTALCYILAVMAYDRYVAICNPLQYAAFMSRKVCILLVSGCWVIGISVSLRQVALVFSMPFCGSKIINHFFCDAPPLFRLLCSGISMNKVEIVLTSILIIIIPFSLIFFSYIRIITTILRIQSVDGRSKAINTCSSHLISVSLFYGSAIFVYLRPNSSNTPGANKLLSLFYTVTPAILNPIIYSLRNHQVKGALRKLLGGKIAPQNT
ncbi:olfactory receptor 10A7-like [Alligator sinensis]|uniref:Olfactory receptor 10A7-like n=1 Tax=Alligator sinensis TaxID=38654 RepID=A0A1U8DMR5_ALLSI|nr:olfactory receptor 10A7-like [Alligator sinensis]